MKKIIPIIIIFVISAVFLSAHAQTSFQEVKLRSDLFNGAIVGKTVVPSGWQIYLSELTLNPESIT